MTESLEGVALVTGGGSGIARETALLLGAAGARVAVADIDPDAAQRTVEAIAAADGNAAMFEIDVADADAVQRMVSIVESDLGPVDYLVNLAGSFDTAPLAEISDDLWTKTLSVHLNGTFYTCRAILPGMAERGRGAVVNTSSIFALRGQAEAAHYAAAKGAVIGFSKSIAREVAPSGVRVNVVAPGPVDTPFFARGMSGDALDQVRRERARIIPLGRIGRADEIAPVILFLLGRGAAHMTGQVIPVEGGEMMR
ncbi:MAG: SDR family NAD(P)-dependent oxidoreductase [Proteobacteria bacterium]|nr:SDR family NAD(P)-dependent oxidoreductase [Pseudomonadota bacterium]